MKVGIVGCGNISGIYLKNLTELFTNIELKSCADLDMDRATAAAEKHGIKAVSVDEIMADEEISIILNLTIPKAHFEVAIRAVEAGKSVHSEKPLTLTREEGKTLLAAAEKNGVRVGCAPDTFMGAGIQTAIKLIEDGEIGDVVAANAFMTCHGHESWHPDPEFYYKAGGGPMFDMGPYYVTALVALVGPVKAISGMARVTFPERTITSEAKNGQKITVDVPTHISGIMDFANGAIGTIVTSFDVWNSDLPCIEIHGTKGSISVPDPNGFGGTVKLSTEAERKWKEIPLTHGLDGNGRGVGVSDMAAAIEEGRAHRASGELAYHVLDIMHAFHDSSDQGKQVTLESTCATPESMPEKWAFVS